MWEQLSTATSGRKPERRRQTTDTRKVMMADSDKPQTAARVDQRRDYREISLWVGIAILDLAMLALCAMGASLDLRAAQGAVMVTGP
jgi:hypothetical protein